MTYKESDTKTDDVEAAKAEKQAAALPKSAGALIDEARKADTRADADAQTNQAPNPNAINLVKQLEDSLKEPEDKPKEKPLDDAEYERRTRLDVSNPDYINPSLDHGKK